MRKIYEFSLNKTEKIKKTETITNDKGEKIEQTKLVDEIVPHKYFLAKPNRKISDDSEIFRAAMESEYIKRGILTATLLQKRYAQDDGIFSEKEKKEHEVLTEKFLKLQSEYSELVKVPEKDRTEEQKKVIEDSLKELGDTFGKFNELENLTSNLYNRSAEALARNRTCLWLALMQSYEDLGGDKMKPVFGEGDFESKLKIYDSIEEKEEPYDYELIQKLILVASLWYLGRATTKEEFDNSLVIFENQNLIK